MEKKFKAKVLVWIGRNPLPYESGWMSSKAEAEKELNNIINHNLPAGLYDISMQVVEKEFAV